MAVSTQRVKNFFAFQMPWKCSQKKYYEIIIESWLLSYNNLLSLFLLGCAVFFSDRGKDS